MALAKNINKHLPPVLSQIVIDYCLISKELVRWWLRRQVHPQLSIKTRQIYEGLEEDLLPYETEYRFIQTPSGIRPMSASLPLTYSIINFLDDNNIRRHHWEIDYSTSIDNKIKIRRKHRDEEDQKKLIAKPKIFEINPNCIVC